MKLVNRSVAIVKPKQKYVDWANSCRHAPGYDVQASIEELSNDAVAYLIPEFDSREESIEFLDELKAQIFEDELEAWSLDESEWPKIDLKASFDDWFAFEIHSMVHDAVRSPIRRESV